MSRTTISLLLLLATGFAYGQTETPAKAEQMAPVMQDPYQGGWQAEDQTRNANLWGVLVEEQPANNDALLNQYRIERNASLARNSGTIPPADQANLDVLAAVSYTHLTLPTSDLV